MTTLTAAPTLVLAARPARRLPAIAFDVLLVLAGTVLLALSARVAVPLPFSPVPVTGQTFAVLLVGALFGARRGAATVVAYLAEGAIGLPVFAAGGAGAATLVGPTGGYLAGFVAAAWITGALAEKGWDRRPLTTAAAMTIGTIAILAGGAIWLAGFIGFGPALTYGVLPFIPGAIVKIALAVILLPVGWRILARLR